MCDVPNAEREKRNAEFEHRHSVHYAINLRFLAAL
jgi:hypothetical protein